MEIKSNDIIQVGVLDLTSGNNMYMDCPSNICVNSNIYCIKNELGDGICQDYNNGPYCDFDFGDCCFGNKTGSCCFCACNYLFSF